MTAVYDPCATLQLWQNSGLIEPAREPAASTNMGHLEG